MVDEMVLASKHKSEPNKPATTAEPKAAADVDTKSEKNTTAAAAAVPANNTNDDKNEFGKTS